MPTPVNAARQCLTQEAAAALDEAVAVARRRGHSQTTSLHLVSSLLSLPNSSLREACARTRNNAYSTRVQFKALELSLSVSLDRLPSSQASKVEEPPVSNSLMAAIKRSQANQRRQPENFTYYQQQQQQYSSSSSSSSVPVVKVELQNLILSILDDPLVSRVFGEAGFRSCDIKMAILRPGNSFHAHHLFGYTSRYKRPSPPLFLSNLTSSDTLSEVGSRSFSFPFMGCFSGDENSRRIGEVMLRDKKRCPLLLGVSAADALRKFLETVQMKIKGVLPEGLSGVSVVCLKDEILRYLNGDCDEEPLKLRFEEVERLMAETSARLVVNLGDLKVLAGDGVGVDCLRYLVGKLAKLVEAYRGKLWLIGAAATYEIYYKILNKFPSFEEDWDLEVLPITSPKFPLGGSYPRSSLMESFVPLGGFFSMPPEMKSTSSNARQYGGRCHLCNEKYEREVAALPKEGLCSSIAQQCQSSLPSWLQNTEPASRNDFSSIKGTDDRLLLNAKVMALQRKWDLICQQQHHFHQTLSNEHTRQFSNNSNESSNEQTNKNIVSPSMSNDLGQTSSLKGLSSLDMLSEAPSGGPAWHHFGSLSATINADRTSRTSVTSVTTDLGLGIPSATTSTEPEKQADQSRTQIVKDPKLLYKALVERVSQQEEAVRAIIEILTRCQTRTSNLQGVNNFHRNIWIDFHGPDRVGKRKIGLALAEQLYGSAERLIYVDLSFQDETTHINTLFKSQVTNKYDLSMRGTVVDYLVEKLSKKPSIVFLENIDKADPVVQNSLSQAVKTGHFTDLRGREVTVSNCIFLGTATTSQDMSTEEDILRAKGSLIQILIRFDLNDDPTAENLGGSHPSLMSKRKVCGSLEVTKRPIKASKSYLDLNLPAEGLSEICQTWESDSDSSSENSRSWLDEFEAQIAQVVVFKPLDFDSLYEKIFKKMSECLCSVVGSELSVEFEANVMQQLLAAACFYGNETVEDWIENVLSKGFVEAMGRFSLNSRSVVKLVPCEDTVSDEQHEGLLPARIIIK